MGSISFLTMGGLSDSDPLSSAELEDMRKELLELRLAKETSESGSSRADSVARMEAELRELREAKSKKSEASSSRADTVARMEAELRELREAKSKKSEASSSRADTVSRMEKELRELREAKTRKSAREDTVARMEAELRELRDAKSSKASSKMDTLARLEAELKAAKMSSSASSLSTASSTAYVRGLEAKLGSESSFTATDTIRRLEEEKRLLEKELGAVDEDTLRTALATERKNAQRRKGVDICFLVDCTGSMHSWIAEVK